MYLTIISPSSDNDPTSTSSDNVTTSTSTSPNNAISRLFLTQACFWRDILALTWNFRTFDGIQRINAFMNDVILDTTHIVEPGISSVKTGVSRVKPGTFRVKKDQLGPGWVVRDPGGGIEMGWVQSSFDFETEVGLCSGIVRLVPVPGSRRSESEPYSGMINGDGILSNGIMLNGNANGYTTNGTTDEAGNPDSELPWAGNVTASSQTSRTSKDTLKK